MNYTLNQLSDTHIELCIKGKITQEDMKNLLDEWIQATSTIREADSDNAPKNATMLYRIENLAMPTFSAVIEEMRRMPKLWETMKYFGKMAVISDQKWIQKIAEIEGWMLSNLDVKGFDPSDESAAKAWLKI